MRLVLTAVVAVVALLSFLFLVSCGQKEQEKRLLENGQIQGVVASPKPDVSAARVKDYGPTKAGVDFKAPRGDYLLVTFGYTSCPDICPTTMADIRLAIAELPKSEQKRVTPVFVTVDPARDTPDKLNQYLGNFFAENYQARWPNSESQLRQVEKPFAVSSKKGKVDKSGNYPMSHTAGIYAVNDQGKVAVKWLYPIDPGVMSADLKVLLNR